MRMILDAAPPGIGLLSITFDFIFLICIPAAIGIAVIAVVRAGSQATPKKETLSERPAQNQTETKEDDDQ